MRLGVVAALKRTALFGVIISTLTGCGPRGPVTYPVSGTVKVDGQPVANGEIIFRAADGATGSWEAKITDGSYSLESTAGEKRVEITARRKIDAAGNADSGEPAFSFEAYIPEKYNEKSDLKATVTSAGPNVFDFDLEAE